MGKGERVEKPLYQSFPWNFYKREISPQNFVNFSSDPFPTLV